MAGSAGDNVAFDADAALRTALAEVPQWRGLTVRHKRVNAGYTNYNYLLHVEEEGKTYFAKIAGPGTETFINRKVAHEASVLSAECGVGPRVVHYIASKGLEVYEFLDGFRNFTIDDMRDPVVAGRIMRAYAKIHAGPPLAETKTGFEQIREHLEQVLRAAADTPPALDSLLLRMEQAEKAIRAAGMRIAPCFNDCYVTNYMVNEDREVRIIDWEYGANNDPYWDIASYFFECFADAGMRHELLRSYDPRAREAEENRVTLYIPLVCLKWGLWASLQSAISSIPFDYLKYADILFMRAQYLMSRQEWDRALGSL